MLGRCLSSLPAFELETFLSRWEFKAQFNLSASDCESLSLGELLAMASDEQRADFSALRLGYTQTYGLPALRSAIASTYDSVGAEQVLCFAGAEEGLYTAMRVLLSAGDHAVVLLPCYQSAETVALAACGDVTGVLLDEHTDWSLDVPRLRAALRPNTKLIAVNFPHNPTGAVLSRDSYAQLVDLCNERGIYLFSDEVYRGIESDAVRLPQAADVCAKGVSLNVMSKAYGLPGLRIGWLACKDRDLLARCERYKHYLSICNSAPSELLAVVALHARQRILERNRRLADANAAKLAAFFQRYPRHFRWTRAGGGCLGFPAYTGPGSADDFCRQLLDEKSVLLLPPSVYRSALLPHKRWNNFRVGFGRADFDQGIHAWSQFMDNFVK